MKYKAFLTGVFILLLSLPLQAQNARELVFRNLDTFFSAEPEVEINLNKTLLTLISRAPNEDEDTKRIIQNLKAVHVRTYSLRRVNRTDMLDKIGEISDILENNRWEVMAKAKESTKFSEILIYPVENNLIGGMLVLALDGDDEEFTIVNLEGNIDPNDLSALGARFGVDALHNLRNSEFVELPCRGEDRYTEACMRQAEALQLQNDVRRLQEELHRSEAEQQRRVREGVAQEQQDIRTQIRQLQDAARQKQEEARRLYDANAPRERDQNTRRGNSQPTPAPPQTRPPEGNEAPPAPPAENNNRRSRDGK